jgi:transcription elongation factor GreA
VTDQALLTKERLEAELERLEVELLAAQDAVAAGQGVGDIAENTDVALAISEVVRLRSRIRQVTEALKNPLTVENLPKGVVGLGRLVTISFGSDDPETFLFGSVEDRHPDYQTLTVGSPVGQALDGAKKGDTVSVDLGATTQKITIREVVSLT